MKDFSFIIEAILTLTFLLVHASPLCKYKGFSIIFFYAKVLASAICRWSKEDSLYMIALIGFPIWKGCTFILRLYIICCLFIIFIVKFLKIFAIDFWEMGLMNNLFIWKKCIFPVPLNCKCQKNHSLIDLLFHKFLVSFLKPSISQTLQQSEDNGKYLFSIGSTNWKGVRSSSNSMWYIVYSSFLQHTWVFWI